MWIRVKYRDTTGRTVGYLFWARDPGMMVEYLSRTGVVPEQVERLWFDEGNGLEPWRPEVLKHIWTDIQGRGA
ncbi:hypothetical protein HMPREF9374_1132 [Desmospora sp. 8437]|nr:hypothetical protein HMPREF9374_1132 [Desmospora sp. 8437]